LDAVTKLAKQQRQTRALRRKAGYHFCPPASFSVKPLQPISGSNPMVMVQKLCEKDRVAGSTFAPASIHPQTIGREERYHEWLKLEHLYRVLPNNRSELIEVVSSYGQLYNYERLHMTLGYRTPPTVYLTKDGQKL
jgi:hypothetical protein